MRSDNQFAFFQLTSWVKITFILQNNINEALMFFFKFYYDFHFSFSKLNLGLDDCGNRDSLPDRKYSASHSQSSRSFFCKAWRGNQSKTVKKNYRKYQLTEKKSEKIVLCHHYLFPDTVPKIVVKLKHFYLFWTSNFIILLPSSLNK